MKARSEDLLNSVGPSLLTELLSVEEGKEKSKEDFEKSIQEEAKINERRKKSGKGLLTVIFKGDLKLLAENDDLRDKFHHARDVDSPLPHTFSDEKLTRLSNPNLYK